MNPFLENIIISLCTGLISGGTLLLQTQTERDWIAVATTFIIGFAGSLINGMRQLQKEPPR